MNKDNEGKGMEEPQSHRKGDGRRGGKRREPTL